MNYFLPLYCLKKKEREEQIVSHIKDSGVDFKRKENLYAYSIRYKDKPVFVAHMDIVGDIGADQILSEPIIVKTKDTRFLVRTKPEVLGADDLAGVALILNNLKDINFVLTQDEETGMAGARSVFEDEEFLNTCKEFNVTGFIEFDRKGTDNIIGNIHGYCCKNFSDDIIAEAKKVDITYNDVNGGSTDVGYICNKYSAANLSVGYYNQHNANEFMNLDHLDKCNELLKLLNENITDASRYTPGTKGQYSSYSNSYSGYRGYAGFTSGRARTSYDDYYDRSVDTKYEVKKSKNSKEKIRFKRKHIEPIEGFIIVK